jgi:GAF domain-containing protein
VIWNWIKSLRWLKTLGLIATAVALAMAGAQVASRKRKAKAKEEREQEFLAEGSSQSIEKARALKESAQKDIDKGVEAKKRMDAKAETIGEMNEDLDELMDHFNSERVRLKQGSGTS